MVCRGLDGGTSVECLGTVMAFVEMSLYSLQQCDWNMDNAIGAVCRDMYRG